MGAERAWCWLALGLTASMALAEPPEFRPMPVQREAVRGGMGNVIAKLNAGQAVRIAYFGGSITAAGDGWRERSLAWFRERWPNATVDQIHAAIGGTPSMLGAYRLQHDVLRHQPDLVFVEFAVNDGTTDPKTIWQAMEGIVRQIWTHDPTIDICYVYTFRGGFETSLDKGECPHAMSAHEILADYYQIPSINFADRTAELIREGRMVIKPDPDRPAAEGVIVFSNDAVHPLAAGHEVYKEVLAAAVESWLPTSRPGPHELKAPLMANNWERAKIVALQPAMLSPGWRQLPDDHQFVKSFGGRMPGLWEATEPGETITFKFKGTHCSLYDLIGPKGGQAVVTVDGKEVGIRPRFDSYCTYYRIATMGIASGVADEVHTVEIRIHPDQPDRSPVVTAGREKPDYDRAKYDGTGMWVGGIMLIGELVTE